MFTPFVDFFVSTPFSNKKKTVALPSWIRQWEDHSRLMLASHPGMLAVMEHCLLGCTVLLNIHSKEDKSLAAPQKILHIYLSKLQLYQSNVYQNYMSNAVTCVSKLCVYCSNA